MRLTPHQKKQLKIILILLIGIPLTSYGVYRGVQYVSRAGADATPRDVIVSNITTSSASISWLTEKPVDTYLIPIINGTEQSPLPDKRGEGTRLTHYVELKSLEPSTKYSFAILSDGEKYTKGLDKVYELTTAPISESTPVPSPVNGSVTGTNADDAVVYVIFKNKEVYPASVAVPSNGNWIIDLSTMRRIDTYEMVNVSDQDQIVLLVKGVSGQGAVLEGSYSSLFDSKGSLNRSLSLEIDEVQGLIDYFPQESILGVNYAQPEPELDPEPDPNPDPEPDNLDQDDPRIKYDIAWSNILLTQLGGSSLEYGEETVLVTNVTDTNFTLVWRSSQEEEGYVKYGTTKEDLSDEIRDIRDNYTSMGKYISHFLESDRLESETTYYFEIYSGDEIYDNNGEKYSVTTFPTLSSPPPLDIKEGKITNNEDLSDWIVVFSIVDSDELGTEGSSTQISTLPDENGEWFVTIGDTRNDSGTAYFSYSDTDILQAFVLGAQSKKFDFGSGQNDFEIDLLEIVTGSTGRVELLTDYGILNIQ